MAAEYSRELSIKAFAGHRRLASLGYRQEATPGFGIRRMLLSANGEPRGLLKNGERKSIKTDRVVLVPGPPEEVALVRWMFERYLKNGNCAAMARELNARGIFSDRVKPWVYETIRNLLDAEKEAMRTLLGDKGARGMLAQCGYLRLGQARIGRRAENGNTDGVVVMEGMVVSRLVSAVLREP